jgi:hypothetical protein
MTLLELRETASRRTFAQALLPAVREASSSAFLLAIAYLSLADRSSQTLAGSRVQ